ncbi:MAG: gamma-glutamyltransferase [Gammaproteobacteria bacterium]
MTQKIKYLIIFLCALSYNSYAQNLPLNPSSITHPVFASKGMVATQHYLASEVGENILAKGGNAYDASIAVGFALAVVLPRAGNIGGGGFMVMHDASSKRSFSIDYREKAPLKASRDMYLNQDGTVNTSRSTLGYLAIGVPGTVYGMWEVHKKFGSMPWNELIQPSIDLARNGFVMSPYMTSTLNRYHKKLSKFEPTKSIFYKNYPIDFNTLLIQEDLAKTLTLISQNGVAGFYEGEVADKIVNAMEDNGGLISHRDLKKYRPVWREPLKSTYQNLEIITMGPPSSGGVHLIQMLNILEKHNLKALGHNNPRYVALLTEVMKYAYADRSKYLGDPDFFEVPVSQLISKEYANTINQRLNLYNFMIPAPIPSTSITPGQYFPKESLETTHYSIADQYGNIISNTYTLNSAYGSGVTIEGTGILMNNEMDDFSASPGTPNQFGLLGGEANEIIPEKRPLSSMTPTIVLKDDVPYFATGTPGGSRIITSVLQSILNIVDFDFEVSDAILKPRIHHQWFPDKLELEKSFNSIHAETLEQKGYAVSMINPATALQIVMMKNNYYYGFGDTRRPDSLAIGVN